MHGNDLQWMCPDPTVGAADAMRADSPDKTNRSGICAAAVQTRQSMTKTMAAMVRLARNLSGTETSSHELARWNEWFQAELADVVRQELQRFSCHDRCSVVGQQVHTSPGRPVSGGLQRESRLLCENFTNVHTCVRQLEPRGEEQ